MNTDEQKLGGGSGGDTGMSDKGHQVKSARGTYQIGGNQVVLVSRKNIPPAPDGPSRIVLLAAGGLPGAFIDDGTVDVRGCKGVRITAGPVSLPMASPETSSADTLNGVDIGVSELQNIRIQRGLTPVDQQIQMTPQGITIDAGDMPVTIQSLTQVTLSVAGGLNTITLSPEGITIQGVMITIQGAMVQIN
jgi:hypothetical protein